MATATGGAGNDFIHRLGDGKVIPAGYADVTGVTTGNDTIGGLGGDDIIFGDGGNDVIDGGTGADQMTGGPATIPIMSTMPAISRSKRTARGPIRPSARSATA